MIYKTLGSIVLFAVIFLSSCGGRHGRQRDLIDSCKGNEIVENEESSKSTTKKNYPTLKFRLYLESSGSMYGYDSNSSKGEFKKTVSDMLNSIPDLSGDSTSLFIVNNDVYPLEKTIRSFIAQRDIFGSTSNIGNPNYTDFARIFEIIMSDLDQNQISILFSDLIYSVAGQESVIAQKLMNEASALTNAVFKFHRDIDVLIVKFVGDYQGAYYSYNSPTNGVQYTGNRPFYAMIFAKHRAFTTLWEDPKYANFRQFGKLGGYENEFCFMSQAYDPSLEIKTRGYGKKGFYNIKQGKVISAKAKDGQFAIPISINLSDIPLSNNYKMDKDVYKIESKGGFKILETGNDPGINLDNNGNIIMVLSGKPLSETISISMKYELPRWIKNSSTEDDTDLTTPNFGSTTFAFKEMMEGIFLAFNPSNDHNLFTKSLTIVK